MRENLQQEKRRDRLLRELEECCGRLSCVYEQLFIKNISSDSRLLEFDLQLRKKTAARQEYDRQRKALCRWSAYHLVNNALIFKIACDKGLFSAGSEDEWVRQLADSSLPQITRALRGNLVARDGSGCLPAEDIHDRLRPTARQLAEMNSGGNDGSTPESLWQQAVRKLYRLLASPADLDLSGEPNILGDLYEMFRDREERKAGGQYYTPSLVVEYILENTLADVDVLDNPFVKVFDPACGSGNFLVKAYDLLYKKFLDRLPELKVRYSGQRYRLISSGGESEVSGRDYWRPENLHFHLLSYCIYGADIDRFAVQLAAVILLLKGNACHRGIINLVECDSLIWWEQDYDWRELKAQLSMPGGQAELQFCRVRSAGSFKTVTRQQAEQLVRLGEFWSQKFDVIVGNPPYLPITKLSLGQKNYFKLQYRFATGRLNTFSLFLERVLSGCKPARLGFVVPSRLLLNTQYAEIRRFLLTNARIKKICDLSQGIFAQATVDTIVMIIEGGNAVNSITTVEYFSQGVLEQKVFRQDDFLQFDNFYINIYTTTNELPVIGKIRSRSVRLGEIAQIRDGIIQGAVGQELFLGSVKIDDPRCKKVLFGENITPYSINWDNQYIWYDKDALTGLEEQRTKGRGRGLRLREPAIFERDKILTRQTADRIIAALDLGNHYYMNTLHGTHITDNRFDLHYLLGVLNSSLTNFYYTGYNHEVGKTFAQVKIANLNRLPVVEADRATQARISRLAAENAGIQDQLRRLKFVIPDSGAEAILAEYARFADRSAELNRRYCHNLRQIDAGLYDCLGLTAEERQLIEQTNKAPAKQPELTGLPELIALYLLERALVVAGQRGPEVSAQAVCREVALSLNNFTDLCAILRMSEKGRGVEEVFSRAIKRLAPRAGAQRGLLSELAGGYVHKVR